MKIDMAPAVKSLARLDGWIDRIYREILKHGNKDENHLSPRSPCTSTAAASSWRTSRSPPQHKEAVDYFLGQARKYWLKLACRQSQGHLAVALKRFGDKDDRRRASCSRSRNARSATRSWACSGATLELSWWWYRAPIETQAMMIEAFDEVMNDAAGGRGLQGLAAEAEADPGLEDHQGHGRRGLRPAAARRRTCWPPTRWSR